MRFHQKRIRAVAGWALLAGGGYGAGWWHHSIRNTASSGRDAPSQTIQGTPRRKDANSLGKRDGSSSDGRSSSGDGNDGNAETADYAQIVRQILADPVKASYQNLYEPFRGWVKQDRAAAAAAFFAEPRLQGGELPSVLCCVLGMEDPESALALLQKVLRKSWTEMAVAGLAQGWAGVSPQAAAAAGLAMPAGAVRRKFLSTVSAKWLSKDPVGLAAWLKSLPQEENLGSMLGELYIPPGNVKSAEAMSAAMEVYKLAPESGRGSTVMAFTYWLNSSPAEAISWAFQLPAGTPNRKEILFAAAERSPDHEIALDLLASLAGADDRLLLTKGIAASWAKSDMEAAWRWASSLDDPAAKAAALESMRARLIAESPDKAVEFLSAHQPDQISTWGPEAAAAWAKWEPDAALAWTKELPPEQRGEIASKVIQAIAKVDAAKAFSEALLHSDESTRRELLYRTASAFAVENVTMASGRINAMPHGPDRDLAIEGLIRPAFEVEPESGLRWALAIDDPHHRQVSLNDGFSRWFKSDPVAAEQWLGNTSLSEELREQLRGTIASVRKAPPVR